jgi:plastocyanin domain-containing protein
MKQLILPTLLSTLLGLGLAACGSDEQETSATPAAEQAAGQQIEITVNGSGYEPAEVQAAAGQPLTLVFTRTTDEGCGEELVIASQDIRRDLPLNEPVEVTFTPTEAGNLRFTCGMDMYDGTIVVQ